MAGYCVVQENRQRVILEEKRRKREEAKRAADEARKKKKGTNAAPKSPVDDTNIIDNLLKEIRAGTTLRPTSTQLKRHRPSLKTAELEKLKKIAEVATSPTYKSPSSSLQRNFNFPESRDPVDMIVEEATRQIAEEAAQKKAAGPGTVEPSQDVPLAPTTPPDQTAPLTTPPDQTAPPTTPPDQMAPLTTPPDQTAPLTTPPDQTAPLITPPDQTAPPTTPPDQTASLTTPPDQMAPLTTPLDQTAPLTTPPDQMASLTTPPDQTAPRTTPSSSTQVIKPLTVNQNGEPEADTKQNGELEVADQLQPPSDGGEGVEKEEEPRVKVAVWDEEKLENGIDSSPTRQVRQLFLYSTGQPDHLT